MLTVYRSGNLFLLGSRSLRGSFLAPGLRLKSGAAGQGEKGKSQQEMKSLEQERFKLSPEE